jgi:hypothetical protein
MSEDLLHFVLEMAAFHELQPHFMGLRLLLHRSNAHFSLRSQRAALAPSPVY